MTKEEMIKDLKNVKLVIGNGYDLHCGLKSSYADFFMRDVDKNDYFNKWLDDFKEKINLNAFTTEQSKEDVWVEFKSIDELNIWDLFFYIETKTTNQNNKEAWLWCDIETVMYNSLKSYDSRECNTNLFRWEHVYKAITKKMPKEFKFWKIYVMAKVILEKRNMEGFKNIDEFYYYILDELNQFEKEFGKFIDKKRYPYRNFLTKIPNTDFEKRSKMTLQELCSVDNLVSIDSFNYDDIANDDLNKILHNINGNLENPIFGIDSNLCRASDPRFIFTKTNRRMELEMINFECQKDIAFDNVIVYGHSLSSNDYSYFFPLLDKLEMTNFLSNKKIIFGFSVYDREKETEIKRKNRLNIQKLFEAYANYKGLKDVNRFLDSLTTQNRVLTYEIRTFENYFYSL